MKQSIFEKYSINYDNNQTLNNIDTETLMVRAYRNQNYLHLKEAQSRSDFSKIFQSYIKRQLGILSDTYFNNQPYELLEITLKEIKKQGIDYSKNDLLGILFYNEDNRVKLFLFKEMQGLSPLKLDYQTISNLFKESIIKNSQINLDIFHSLKETQEQFINANILLTALECSYKASKIDEIIINLLNDGIKWESHTDAQVYNAFKLFFNSWISELENGHTPFHINAQAPLNIAFTLFNNSYMDEIMNFIENRLTNMNSNHPDEKEKDIALFDKLQKTYLESKISNMNKVKSNTVKL